MRGQKLLPAALGGAFLLLYLATLARGVATADNAEFQLVGTQLGVAHPPGFALYTLLAHLVTRLPGGWSPAEKINALAAVIGAATVVAVYAAAWVAWRSRAAAFVAALTYGTLTTVWVQATVANVRGMTALFSALLLWALLAWAADRRTGAPPARADRYVTLAALALGFGVTHHLSLAFMGLVAVAWLLWRDWRVWPRLLWAAVGLLPLIYLPVREPALRAPSALLRYVLGLGFGGDFFAFITPAALWARADVMRNVLTFQTPALLLWAALAGALWLLWRDRPTVVLLGGTLFVHSLITATYRAPQTVEYMLPAYVPLALLAGGVCAAVPSATDGDGRRYGALRRTARPLLALLLVGAAAAHGARLWPSLRALAARGYATSPATAMLAAAPRAADVLTNWHWANTLRYAQAIDGTRNDVTVTYVAPGGEPYGATWQRLITDRLARGVPVVATNGFGATYGALPPAAALPDPAATAFAWPAAPLQQLPADFAPVEIALGDQIVVLGWRMQGAGVAAGESAGLLLAWRPLGNAAPASLFVHLVDAQGQLVAQADTPALAAGDGLMLTRFVLTPRPGALPGLHSVLVGAYLADGTPLRGPADAARVPLLPLTVLPSDWRPVTRHPQRRDVDGRRLVGVDFDQTLADRPRIYLHWQTADGYWSETVDAPAATVGGVTYAVADYCRTACRYVPLQGGIVWLGEAVRGTLRPGGMQRRVQQFVAARPLVDDLTVSVSLTGLADDGVTWAWQALSDGIPALGAIPTLKWVAGSHVRDPHTLAVPATARPGQTVEARLILYDAFTQRTLAVLDERIAAQGIGIPLGRATVAP